MNWHIQLQLHQFSCLQIVFDKFLNDASHAQSDPDKLDQQIHGGHFQQVVGLDLIERHIFVHIVTGNITAV